MLNYVTGNPLGLQYEFNNDTAYFKKSINDNSAQESSGTRIYNQFATRYNYRTPAAFVIPELSVRSIQTFYDKDSIASQGLDGGSENKSVIVPQFTLDTGLNFEREGKYLQTLTPRAFYAYAPYKNQDGYLTLTQPLRQLVTISYLTLTASMVMTALKTITFYR